MMTPTEITAYVVAGGTVVGGFAKAVTWLDARRAKDREELEARIFILETEHKKGRSHVIEAITLCPKGTEFKKLSDHLIAAADALS